MMNVEVRVWTYRGGAAQRWQRLVGKGRGGDSLSSIGGLLLLQGTGSSFIYLLGRSSGMLICKVSRTDAHIERLCEHFKSIKDIIKYNDCLLSIIYTCMIILSVKTRHIMHVRV